jgi:magnesium-transporting ATPase (P-type)
MYFDHNFVRVLAACETMGNATTICSDKTGTLTTNKMTVIRTWLAESFYSAGEMPGAIELNGDVRKVLLEGLALNSKVFEKSPKDWADPETPVSSSPVTTRTVTTSTVATAALRSPLSHYRHCHHCHHVPLAL